MEVTYMMVLQTAYSLCVFLGYPDFIFLEKRHIPPRYLSLNGLIVKMPGGRQPKKRPGESGSSEMPGDLAMTNAAKNEVGVLDREIKDRGQKTSGQDM